MPTTVNGIGTKYYGTRNLRTYQGVCESCHRTVELRDYETTYFFVVAFIPIVPLGKKQVLADCPVCRRHRVVSLGEWEKMREASLAAGSKALNERPDDPQAALELLRSLSLFSRYDEAENLALAVQHRFDDNADVQTEIGHWHEYRRRPREAAACFQTALAIEPSNLAAKCGVVRALLFDGRPDEAQSLCDVEPRITAEIDPDLILSLAKAHQRCGNHQAALVAFRQVKQAVPKLAKDGQFRSLVRASEKECPCSPPMYSGFSQGQSCAVLVSAAVLLGLAVLLAMNYHIATHRELHLVNGFDVPVAVRTDDQPEVVIPAHSRVVKPVAEGMHHAVVTCDGKPVSDQQIQISTAYASRWFSNPVFVFNAGGGAAILWEKTTYATTPVDEGESSLNLGGSLIVFDDVDFPFQEFPATIKLKNGKKITRTRVAVADIRPEYALLIPDDVASLDDRLRFVETHLRLMPDLTLTLQAYASIGESAGQGDRVRRFIAEGIEEVPLRIEWHRVAEYLAKDPAEHDALRKRYRQMLQANPNDADALYLLGRMETHSVAVELFDRAIAADPSSPYSWQAKAYLYHQEGDFAAAKAAYEKAIERRPDDPQIRSRLDEVRFALGEFAALEKEVRTAQLQNPQLLASHVQFLRVLVAQGKDAEARRASSDYVSLIGASGENAEFTQDTICAADTALHYLLQDFAGLLSDADATNQPHSAARIRYQAQLELGDIKGAEASLAECEVSRAEAFDALRIGIGWGLLGESARASQWLDRARVKLEQGNEDERSGAALLRSAPEVSWVDVQELDIEPKDKVVLLIALAQQQPPEKRSVLLKLARRLNYALTPSHFFNERAIKALQ